VKDKMMSKHKDDNRSLRQISVALIQGEGYGNPASTNIQKNLDSNIKLLDQACQEHHPTIVVFPEMFTTPYFCGAHDTKFFEWAETIPGPTIERLSSKAKEYGCYILAPIFEKVMPGEYYDSAALIGPDGNLVNGVLPGGGSVKCYRKTHIATLYAHTTQTNEKLYFSPGGGFPIFETDFGRVGVLICYDRSFPEAWRSLAVQGAELILIPVVSYGFRQDAFLSELQTRSMENIVFCAAANRGGSESVAFEVVLFGSSVAIDPRGKIIAKGSDNTGPEIVIASMDLNEVEKTRTEVPYFRDRRPDIYLMKGPNS
jgi:N-carbamoylputrescine amidase